MISGIIAIIALLRIVVVSNSIGDIDKNKIGRILKITGAIYIKIQKNETKKVFYFK